MKHDIEKEKENLEEELSGEKKSTLIEFYKLTLNLWNTSLIQYRDRDLRKVTMEKLAKEFDDKYPIKKLSETWHKLLTYYEREKSITRVV